jgi:acyl phosphate:glycerol-3-phosphate acyltransferase
MLKGFVPVILAWAFAEVPGLIPIEDMAIAGALAILGHVFSPFLKFKGGKGVATTIGVILALQPTYGLLIIALFIGVLLLTKYVSLGSILAALMYAVMVLIYWNESIILSIFAIGLAILIILKHKANIDRLLKGEENRFKLKRS